MYVATTLNFPQESRAIEEGQSSECTSSTKLVREVRIESIYNTLNTLIRLASYQIRQHLHQFNLTEPQFVTLYTLTNRDEPITMQSLAQSTLQDSASMTGIVSRLVKMGVVERTRSTQDRRVVIVAATATGKRLANKVFRKITSELTGDFELFSDIELAILERFLVNLHNQKQRHLSIQLAIDLAG